MDQLVWGEYDRKLRSMYQEESDIENYLGLARYPFARFYRELFTYRAGHFSQRVISLNDKIELPTGSLLHIADNFWHMDNPIDVPRYDENTWLERESYKKYICHIREPKLSGPIVVDDKYIYRPAGLPSKLMSFRSQMGSKFKYINVFTEIPTKKEALVVVNHNPIFRIKVFGRLPFFRRFQLIFASILNTMIALKDKNKIQFLEIPWDDSIFDKAQFIRTREKLTPMSVRYPNNLHYLFMMHLVNFMWNESSTSMLKQIPSDMLSQINFILKGNDKYIFYNLQDLINLNEKNRMYIRFINQLNLLSVLSRVDEKKLSPQEKELLQEHLSITTEVEQVEGTKQEIVTEYKVKEDDDKNIVESVQEKVSDTIARIANVIPKKITNIARSSPVITNAIPTPDLSEPTKGITDKSVLNVTAAKKISKEEVDLVTQEYLFEYEKTCDTFIDNQDQLSTRQKDRYKQLARKYKTLTLGGRKLEEILLSSNDISIGSSTLDSKQIGDIPDKSALHCSLIDYNRAYLENTYPKHLAAIFTYFAQNGVYLTDIKEEKKVTNMSKTITYRLSFEDIEGRRTTSPITLPIVDKEGRIMIDGKKQILKKQRLTLPLVKISDMEISLASNYNKTRVERNINKAHNFFSFIDGYINNSDKSNANIVYGSGYPNLPVSYEYCAIADRYNQVDWRMETDDKDEYSLYFEFSTRSTHFEGSEEDLKKLEAIYGVYFGKNKKNHFFINNENEVHAINKYGGEDIDFGTKSIVDVLELALKEGYKFNKQLTEWISIKILDKHLPVIFMLAYKYGLRNILDYMGVKYTITEGRSKVIIGESNKPNMDKATLVAGNASIDLGTYEIDKEDKEKSPFDMAKDFTLTVIQQIGSILTDIFGVFCCFSGHPLGIKPESTVAPKKNDRNVVTTTECLQLIKQVSSMETKKLSYNQIEWELTQFLRKNIRPYERIQSIQSIKKEIKEVYGKDISDKQVYEYVWTPGQCLYGNCEKIYNRYSNKMKQLYPEYYQYLEYNTGKILYRPFIAAKMFTDTKIEISKLGIQLYGTMLLAHERKHSSQPIDMLDMAINHNGTSKCLDSESEYDANQAALEVGKKWMKTNKDYLELVREKGRPGNTKYVLYHSNNNEADVKKYGLCSPRAMYNKNRNIFHDITYDKYYKRALEFFGRDNLTDEDIIEYLDNSRPPCNADHIFFYFESESEMPLVHFEGTEYSISLNKLKKYVKGNPVLFLGPQLIEITWDKLIRELPSYINQARSEYNTPYEGKMMFQKILHVSLPCPNPIPYHEFSKRKITNKISGNTVYEVPNLSSLGYIPAKIFQVDIPEPSIRNINGIATYKVMHFPPDKSIMSGSASLVAWGLKEVNDDIDICIEPNYKQSLIDDKTLILKDNKYIIPDTNIEAGVNDNLFSFEEICSYGVMTIDNVTLLNIYGCFRFYHKLINSGMDQSLIDKWTNTYNRMKEGVSFWYRHTCWHASPVQGIKQLDPMKDHTPDDRVQALVYASYNPIFAIVFGMRWDDSIANWGWKIQEDGITPKFTFTIKKGFTVEEIDKPFSLYQLEDDTFDHLMLDNIQHPILEIVSPMSVQVQKEYKFRSWWSVMKELQSQGFIDIVGEDKIIRPDMNKPILSIIDSAPRTTAESDILEMLFPKNEWDKLRNENEIWVIKDSDEADIYSTGDIIKVPFSDKLYQITEIEDTVADNGNSAKKIKLEVINTQVTKDIPISTEHKYKPQPNDIQIKFADRVLWINRYPLKHSLIVAGLDYFDTSSYDLADFESKDIYYQLLQDKNMSTNYLKGIDSFYDLFIDPMTYMDLKRMGEPTNVKDLLLRCAILLSTLDHRPTSSGANHRIRGYEQFAATVYNEMARQFATYQSKRGKANVYSLNPDCVFLRTISSSAMVPCEAAGPIEDFKESSYLTHSGIGGRNSESFVINDRKYIKDDIGIVSEASVDNPKIAINSYTSYDPMIADTMGSTKDYDFKDLTPANVFSGTSLVMPFSTNDDSKRMLLMGTQCSHIVPIKDVAKHRVRTGYERTLAHRVGRMFAGIAEEDGKITKVDESSKLIEVTYKSGKKDIFNYGEFYVEFQGFYATQNIIHIVKQDQTIKKGEIITYNKNYFTLDKETNQLDYSIGTTGMVAMLESDATIEDSSEISEALADRLTMRPTNIRTVVLPAKALIHMYKDIGSDVKVSDNLMIFEEEPLGEGTSITNNASEETLSLLGDINRRTPSAKYSGKVVKIEAYFGCPISEMSKTVSDLVKKCIKDQNTAAKFSQGSEREDDFPEVSVMPKGSKYKGIMFDENTIMFIFYIQEEIPHNKGDKIVFFNQLKSTCCGVFQKPIYSESKIEIDAYFGCLSMSNRVVLSPLLYGISSRIMRKIETDVLDYWFEDKSLPK